MALLIYDSLPLFRSFVSPFVPLFASCLQLAPTMQNCIKAHRVMGWKSRGVGSGVPKDWLMNVPEIPTNNDRLPTTMIDHRQTMIDYRKRWSTTNKRWSITNKRWSITNKRWSITANDDRLPTSDDRLPTNDNRLPTNDDRLPTSDDHNASFYWQAIELLTVMAKGGECDTLPTPYFDTHLGVGLSHSPFPKVVGSSSIAKAGVTVVAWQYVRETS